MKQLNQALLLGMSLGLASVVMADSFNQKITAKRPVLEAITAKRPVLEAITAKRPVLEAITCPLIIKNYAAVTPTADPKALKGAEQAVLCLVNEYRAQSGLSLLAGSDQLKQAAKAHSADWVVNKLDPNRTCPVDPNLGWTWNGCSHQGSDGSWPEDRIQNSGYCRGVNCTVSENTYLGLGSGATPRAAVNWWISDPPHQMTLLDTRFTDAGPGVAFGTWDGKPDGATYTLDFGKK